MKTLNKKAFSIIEYVILLIIVIGGFVLMKSYIQRGVLSQWQQSGQSLAYGRQYDSQKTVECSFDDQSNRWYDRNCYESVSNQKNCNGDSGCDESVITGSCLTATCNQVSD